ncbi:hypothetical protein C1752_03710 [Acaryochloris thomasi RCC1774]|uniref:Uncharacterized protein n=1 Tax=Acaryochloris thomasi RCC1774 TaxID=1764569 RepID=A0A2W1JFQ5_9CYAN|nr:hypothetical protein [Acaryochloris thomasi]PZD72533.1 hypothetical protein C1752_03710 [Acaryochloris thomasi RCC1774]
MAKRRNLKKEKALRNQAYARKFRKRNTGRFGKRFYNRSDNQENNSENQEQDGEKQQSNNSGAADSQS